MAELPPLNPYPERGVTPEFVGQLERSANWARTFGGADTNIAQRYRHNQDISAYASALQDQREQAQADLLQRDKAAQSLYFGMQRLELQEKEATARMRHAAELHPLKIKAQESQIAADLARERREVETAAFKNTARIEEEEDTHVFYKALNEGKARGVRIGTDAWRELIAQARLEAPAMDTKIFDDTWKATSRSTVDPQEAIDQAVAKKKALQAVDVPKPGKPDSHEAFNKDLGEMVKAYGSADAVPKEKWAEFEARKAKIGTTPATPSASPAAALKPLSDDIAKSARAAIAAGKDAAAVAKRLQDGGYDPSGL